MDEKNFQLHQCVDWERELSIFIKGQLKFIHEQYSNNTDD
ncbi:unnamed protein product [Paramecium octaurelia]|uniref:Uncharacterized protein n=1 Tax=Paramecium octaurelia TaxID=43137 RepID=A0A8S1VPL5_PAROT|nr:unnamed protein product [Paramecium octaurelia]